MSWSKDSFSRGFELIGFDPVLASSRAELLVEALDWIKPKEFQLHLEPAWIHPRQKEPIPLLEYSLGKIRSGKEDFYDINNADSPDDDRHTSVAGSGLNQFPLLWFAKAIETAKRLLPELWLKDEGIRTFLRQPDKHPTKLNELRWLDRFLVHDDIRANHILVPGSDIDWRFRVPGVNAEDFWVNLEVKYRVSDVVRAVRYDEGREPHLIRDLTPKFRPSLPNEINLAAITLFGAIDQELLTGIKRWLSINREAKQVLDGVLLWSHDGMSGPDFVGVVREHPFKGRILDSILLQPDMEDRSIIRKYQHVMPRALLPPELQNMWPKET